MDLESYAELAVSLVNSAAGADGEADWLADRQAFGVFAEGRPYLSGPVTHHDLEALRLLRTELGEIFAAVAKRDHTAAATRLNTLLVQYPVRPLLVRHHRTRWHLHLDDSGSVADRYAAGAVTGLTTVVVRFGMSRLGTCAIPSCRQAFVDADAGRPGRRCPRHGASKSSVTAFRKQARPATGYPTSSATG